MTETTGLLPAFDVPVLSQQGHSARLLSHSLEQGQLSHAYLFKGPVPLGLELALALTRALFCPNRGCGSCHVCKAVSHELYPDLYVIRGEGEGQHPTIKLAQIQKLVSQVSLPPIQASHQVFILVAAEYMNKEGSNALLKTLEEPASNSIIILLTPLLERVLPTIRSRSQILPLTAPMPDTASLLAQSPTPEKFWSWEQLETVQTPALLPQLIEQLETLNPAELSLQLQIFQRGCWTKIQAFIVEKRSSSGLRRAYSYLKLFETGLEQLRANANPRLVSTTVAHQFLTLRRSR